MSPPWPWLPVMLPRLLRPRYLSTVLLQPPYHRDTGDAAHVAERTKLFKKWCLFPLLQQGLCMTTVPFTPISAIQSLLPDKRGSGGKHPADREAWDWG